MAIGGLITRGFEPICNPVAIGGLITRGFEAIFVYPGNEEVVELTFTRVQRTL